MELRSVLQEGSEDGVVLVSEQSQSAWVLLVVFPEVQ